MRDGNDEVLLRKEMIDLGYELTYEGWKRGDRREDLSGLSGYELTYEGWKHMMEEHQQQKKGGYELTYEGWKPASGNHCSAGR